LNLPSQNTCPRIPRTIREYYAYLNTIRLFQSTLNRFPRSHAQCVETQTCPGRVESMDLFHGGQSDWFLVALMWASKIECLYTYLYVTLHPTTTTQAHAKLNFDYSYAMYKRNATFNEFAKKIVKTLPKTHPFHVLTFSMHNRDGYKAPQDSRKVVDAMNELADVAGANTMTIQGLMVSMGRQGSAHVVSCYPCYVGGTLKWIACNSWGDNCSRKEFHDFIADLCALKSYTHFLQLTLLIKKSGTKK
jgi:hypothetical protein